MDKSEIPEHSLEFLLGYDGGTHWMEDGHHLRYEIKKVPPSKERPHGLHYSLTLHNPEGERIMGFDNAHGVPAVGSRFKERPETHDHLHRTETDAGRPYNFVSAEQLIIDFLNEVRRVLSAKGLTGTVVKIEDRRVK